MDDTKQAAKLALITWLIGYCIAILLSAWLDVPNHLERIGYTIVIILCTGFLYLGEKK